MTHKAKVIPIRTRAYAEFACLTDACNGMLTAFKVVDGTPKTVTVSGVMCPDCGNSFTVEFEKNTDETDR